MATHQEIPMEEIPAHHAHNPGFQEVSLTNNVHHNEEAATETFSRRDLPSRQTGTLGHGTRRRRKALKKRGYATMRLRHGQVIDPDAIADDLLSDPDFVDSPEELRHDEIKVLATTLANKRSIKSRVGKTESTQQRDRPVGFFKSIKYSIALSWKHFKDNVAEVMYSVDLWRGNMKKIEGQFGSGVRTYFEFLKWLFLMNIPVFFLSFVFVVLPQILHRWLEQESPGYNGNEKFTGLELLTGSGWFKDTELYYGSYINETINFISSLHYEMPYAYLFTSLGYYIITLIILSRSLTSSYKQNFIDGRGANSFHLVTKVLGGWDYSITDENAAKLKHNGLFKDLQERLAEFRQDEDQRSCGQWCSVIMRRALINIIVISLLVGSGYLMWYINKTQSLNTDLAFLSEMAMPLCISGINLVLPFAFSILGSFEKYSNPRIELYLTMLRTIVLNIVTLGVLVFFWFNDVECDQNEADRRPSGSEKECVECWEVFLGTQIYRLVIVDFIVILFLSFFSEFIRRLMAQYCCKSLGFPEFNIGRNILYLIYSQSLVWLGTYYSPLLSLIAVIKYFIIFYVKRFSVMQNCRPSTRAWRGGRTNTFILGLLLCAFVLCFLSVGYGILFITPSASCGPYQGESSTLSILTKLLEGWEGSAAFLKFLLEFITSSGFIIGVLTALCVAVYYTRVQAQGLDEMVELLRHQIMLEGKDKAFLQKLIQNANAAARRAGRPEITGRRAGGKGGGRAGTQQQNTLSVDIRQSPDAAPDSLTRGHSVLGPQKSLYPPAERRGEGSRQEAYNQGYLDTSLEPEINQNISMNPGYQDEPLNPGYSDHSPTHSRPALPYPAPGYQYDIVQPR